MYKISGRLARIAINLQYQSIIIAIIYVEVNVEVVNMFNAQVGSMQRSSIYAMYSSYVVSQDST